VSDPPGKNLRDFFSGNGVKAPTKASWKRPESVLVLVYTRTGQVLLLERTRPRGFWQSVTGSLAWGESAGAAARRELQEETGLDGRGLVDLHRGARFLIRAPWRARYAPTARTNREHWFALLLERPQRIRIHPAEHRAWRWLPAAQAARRASSWTNRRLIREICSI
jgi:dATP pyrophosphohydrolase